MNASFAREFVTIASLRAPQARGNLVRKKYNTGLPRACGARNDDQYFYGATPRFFAMLGVIRVKL